MTLSARIALGPSWRLAFGAALVPSAAVSVGAVTWAANRPDAVWPIGLAAIAVVGAVVLAAVRRHRATPRRVLSVADRTEFDVIPDPAGLEGSWRLAESTVVWPGFAMLALCRADASVSSTVVRIPVFDAEIADADRRSLARFLLWSLRTGRALSPSAGRS